MKLLSILCLVLVISLSLQAQPDLQGFTQAILRCQTHQGPQLYKTTAIKQRLVAMSERNNFQSDSSIFIYSGNNGSEYNRDAMLYNTNYYSDLALGSPEQLNTMRVTYDTSRRWKYSAGQNQTGINVIKYTPLKTITSCYGAVYASSGSAASLDSLEYNAQNRLTHRNAYNYVNFSTWDSSEHATYYYDAQGRMTADSVYLRLNNVWQPSRVLRYVYGPNGTLDTSAQYTVNGQTWSSYIYWAAYNSSNRAVATGIVGGNSMDTLEYDNNGHVKDWIRYKKTGTAWYLASMVSKHTNALGQFDTMYSLTYSYTLLKWDTSEKHSYMYNSFGNPVSEYDIALYFMDTTITRYYYEQYTDAEEGVQGTMDVKVYPNPAKDKLYIAGNTFGQAVVRLYNTLGQCKGSFSFTNSEIIKLNLNGYAAGLYYYRVEYDSSAGMSAGKFVVEQ